MPKVMVFAGTTNGLFVLESDGRRARWRRRGPYLRGQSVNYFVWYGKSKALYAAALYEGIFLLRHGLDVDALRPAGVHVATTTGDIYGSANEGDAWTQLATRLPEFKGLWPSPFESHAGLCDQGYISAEGLRGSVPGTPDCVPTPPRLRQWTIGGS